MNLYEGKIYKRKIRPGGRYEYVVILRILNPFYNTKDPGLKDIEYISLSNPNASEMRDSAKWFIQFYEPCDQFLE